MNHIRINGEIYEVLTTPVFEPLEWYMGPPEKYGPMKTELRYRDKRGTIFKMGKDGELETVFVPSSRAEKK